MVLWYTFGVTHVRGVCAALRYNQHSHASCSQSPQLEDWPVMPFERVGFSLHPSGFFDRSAVMSVPPTSKLANKSREVTGDAVCCVPRSKL
mgnify:CR=1 FL=1